MTYWALKGSSLSQKRDNVQKNEKGKYEGGGQGSREGEKRPIQNTLNITNQLKITGNIIKK